MRSYLDFTWSNKELRRVIKERSSKAVGKSETIKQEEAKPTLSARLKTAVVDFFHYVFDAMDTDRKIAYEEQSWTPSLLKKKTSSLSPDEKLKLSLISSMGLNSSERRKLAFRYQVSPPSAQIALTSLRRPSSPCWPHSLHG